MPYDPSKLPNKCLVCAFSEEENSFIFFLTSTCRHEKLCDFSCKFEVIGISLFFLFFTLFLFFFETV
uniref:Uncharacterized protein n=1 Tax=Anguilla anguilla TaxID=7936 RepID=A0A0E9RG56_ANGAN